MSLLTLPACDQGTRDWARWIWLGVMTIVAGGHVAIAGEKIYGKEVVPLIVIDEVPLSDAIRNLARQMELNYILHPAVPGSGFIPGKLAQEPLVSIRREDVTVAEAMRDVLNAYRLTLVTNPVTTVAQVAPDRRGLRPVPANAVSADGKRAVPLLKLEDVTLAEGLEHVGRFAGIRVSFDPEVPASLLEENIRVRWTNLSARQALAALLDNFGLTMVENRVTRGARIKLKG